MLARRSLIQSAKRCYSIAPARTAPLLQVTTLPSGVRVATESTPGHFSALGVYVDCGARYETQETLGTSHLLDRMFFSSSRNRTAEQMTAESAALGGQFSSTSSRETMIYQATSYTHSVPQALSLLCDTALNPLFDPHELDAQRDSAAWEIQEIKSKPELIMPEMFHQVAYDRKTLGNSLLCPDDRIDLITSDQLRAFHEEWYRPERIVVAAAGVKHDQFVDLVQEQLATYPAASKSAKFPASSVATRAAKSSTKGSTSFIQRLSTSTANKASVVETPKTIERSIYTGGLEMIEDPSMEFTHLYIGYESFSVHQQDYIYPLAVLQTLLGGGGSFSAGGPGKGMYSRLYTSVLNRYHHVDFCSAFHHTYNDSGLFGINIAVHPSAAPVAAKIVAQELSSLTIGTRTWTGAGISDSELQRAKNQLKSMLMMALESRAMQVEDLARQVQSSGYKVPVEEMCRRVDEVDIEAITKVARLILTEKGTPTVLVKGKIHKMNDVMATLRSYGLAR